jgi:hypothetical protein
MSNIAGVTQAKSAGSKSATKSSNLNANTYQRKRASQQSILPPSMSLHSIKTLNNNNSMGQVESATHQNESSSNAMATLNNQTSNIHHIIHETKSSPSSQQAHLSSFLMPTNTNSCSITINIHNNNSLNNTNNDIEYSGKTFCVCVCVFVITNLFVICFVRIFYCYCVFFYLFFDTFKNYFFIIVLAI